jgi:putative chitinase
LDINADALVRHFLDNKKIAEKRGFTGTQLEEMIYKYHHDGPSKDFGGLKLSSEKVMPLVADFENALSFA